MPTTYAASACDVKHGIGVAAATPKQLDGLVGPNCSHIYAARLKDDASQDNTPPTMK